MSAREKKLLILFLGAGFIIANFLGISFIATKRIEVKAKRAEAVQKLATAEMFSASREQVLDEMDWLAEHEPEPAAYQDVQTKLQQLAETEARNAGLTIKTQKLLPTQETGVHYHRAKIQLTVLGTEEALYRWFDRLNQPDQFRAATFLRMAPDREDDTKIDCTTIIEQWFVPLAPSV